MSVLKSSVFVAPHRIQTASETIEVIELETPSFMHAQFACGVGKGKLVRLGETLLTARASWVLAQGAVDENGGKLVNKGMVSRDCDRVRGVIGLAAAQ